jgi:Putative inner membrane exporter, YdcZ/Arsenical pump membrane protein
VAFRSNAERLRSALPIAAVCHKVFRKQRKSRRDFSRFVLSICMSWGVLPLVAGLFVLVEGLDRTGVLKALADTLHAAADQSITATAWGAGIIVALAWNLVNKSSGRPADRCGGDRGACAGQSRQRAADRCPGRHAARAAFGDRNSYPGPMTGREEKNKRVSTIWFYPFIIIAGVAQAFGAVMNAQLRVSLANPWLTATVAFVLNAFFFASLFAVLHRPLPTLTARRLEPAAL